MPNNAPPTSNDAPQIKPATIPRCPALIDILHILSLAEHSAFGDANSLDEKLARILIAVAAEEALASDIPFSKEWAIKYIDSMQERKRYSPAVCGLVRGLTNHKGFDSYGELRSVEQWVQGRVSRLTGISWIELGLTIGRCNSNKPMDAKGWESDTNLSHVAEKLHHLDISGETSIIWTYAWNGSRILRETWMQNPYPAEVSVRSPSKPSNQGRSVKRKRNTQKGGARIKLISGLTVHHNYGGDGCLNLEPAINNELARTVDVDKSTASTFFKKEFGSHAKYEGL